TTPPKVEAPPPVETTPPVEKTAKVELTASAPTKTSKTPKPEKVESVPAEIAGELDAAESAIESNPPEAIRLARHTLSTARTSRAFAIVARAFCKQGNLGDAKAQLHNVSGGDRARVVKYCKSVGTDLQ